VEEGFWEDGAGGVLGVAVRSGLLAIGSVLRVVCGSFETYLMIMSFVFGLTRAFSSSKSGNHLFSAFDFHSETSAPRLSGIEYSC
jgi:hypothetical protein